MSISNESKIALNVEIERLHGQKKILNKRIQEITDKRDSLILRRNELNSQIAKLEGDVV